MNTIITYDIAEGDGKPSKHTEVKNAMKELGYQDFFWWTDPKTNAKHKVYLPNTTLWKSDKTPSDAKNELLKVAKGKGAEIERVIAVELSHWSAEFGKPYAAE